MIIDVHAHLWADRYKEDKKTILKACELYSIDNIYISTISSYNPDTDEIEYCNNLTYDFMKEHPKLVSGYIYVNPSNSNRLDVLKRGLDRGMEAVKLWVATKCDDNRVNDIAEYCIDKNIPILAHAFHKATGQLESESTAVNVRSLALRYPKLKIIMAHFGGNIYYGLRCVTDLENVYNDFSGTMIGTGDINYAIDTVGEDRILFGTDLPGGGRQCFAQVEEASLTQLQKDKIYYKNAQKIFGGSQ